jgi:hypothetical protein
MLEPDGRQPADRFERCAPWCALVVFIDHAALLCLRDGLASATVWCDVGVSDPAADRLA